MNKISYIDSSGKATQADVTGVTFTGSINGSHNNGWFTFGQKEKTILDFKPKRVTFNGLTTIVFWSDDTKTIVRCGEEDVYERERAVASAIAHKIFSSKNQFKKFVASGYEAMSVEEELERQREKALKRLET